VPQRAFLEIGLFWAAAKPRSEVRTTSGIDTMLETQSWINRNLTNGYLRAEQDCENLLGSTDLIAPFGRHVGGCGRCFPVFVYFGLEGVRFSSHQNQATMLG
jgi:hypothetical protein